MKNRHLHSEKALRAALFVLLLSVVGTTKMYASYDFSAVCETGQTLYYNITNASHHYVELSCPVGYGGSWSWTGFTKPTGDIILPESVQYNGITYSVTSIGVSAFYSCSGLTSVEIPNSVTSIGGSAFSNCSGLTSIEIPNSVTSIGGSAFSWCSGLTSIEIPNSVTSIGEYAFSRCSGLTSIEIPNSVTSIGKYAFSNCSGLEQITVDFGNTVYDSRNNCNAIINTSTNELVAGCKNTVILNSVTSIGNCAFEGCSGLTSIEIPNSVTSIGVMTFYGCTGLTSIEIPNSVTSIGGGAFEDCTGLTSIEIPNSVTSIGDYTFEGCSGLTSIEIPNSVTSIGGAAFSGCSGLTSIEIPNSVASIGNAAFFCCSSLTSIEIPNSVTSIGDNLFYFCSGLTSIEIPNSVTSIGISAFSYCHRLTTIEIPNSVTYIGDYAFEHCSSLTSIEIPNSVTSIGDYAFDHCTGLTTIEIPNSVASLGNNMPEYTVFSGCSGLEQIIVESGNLFYDSRDNCNAIIKTSTNELVTGCKNTVIPNSVTSIGNEAFSRCRSLASIEIPNSVTFIGSEAFSWCSGLTSMTVLADNPPTLDGTYVFYNVNKSIPVYVPCGSLEAYQNASGWNEFTNIQEICTQTQTVALIRGWNWYSTYIEQEGIDGLGQLENSIGVPRAIIQSKNDGSVESIRQNGQVIWQGTLSSINNEEMYKIATKVACNATIEGNVTTPSEHPITINRGWNSIGFPCNQSVSVNVAMSGFTPKNNDMIKGKNGYATYSNGTWSGTLNTLEPGQGYMYGSKSNAVKTLVYQTGSRGEATLANITPENNYYQPTEDYADNMTMTAIVELDGEELRSDDYELAAFVGDECRGSVKLMYVESIDRYVAFLTVFGEQEEGLRFVLTDGENMNWSDDELAFAVDGMSGTLTELATLRFGTSVQDYVNIFPNPSNGVFNIEGKGIRKVSVIDAYGNVVLSKEAANDIMQIDLSSKATGVYMLQVVTGNGITTRRLIKK